MFLILIQTERPWCLFVRTGKEMFKIGFLAGAIGNFIFVFLLCLHLAFTMSICVRLYFRKRNIRYLSVCMFARLVVGSED